MNPRAILIMWYLTVVQATMLVLAPQRAWWWLLVITVYAVYAYLPRRR